MTSSDSTARTGERPPIKGVNTINLAISFRISIPNLAPWRPARQSSFLAHLATGVIELLLDRNIALCDIADMSRIGFTTTATRQWLKLSPQVRDRIGKKMEAFAATGQGDVKKLKGQAGARLRVGDWRVIFYEEAGTIMVVAVGHRREIYD